MFLEAPKNHLKKEHRLGDGLWVDVGSQNDQIFHLHIFFICVEWPDAIFKMTPTKHQIPKTELFQGREKTRTLQISPTSYSHNYLT